MRYPRRKIIVGSIDQQWGIDLIDVQNISSYNDEKRFILTAVDVLSKYGFAVPLANKSGKEVLKALKIITRDRQPLTIHADQGAEFVNKVVLSWLKKNGIRLFYTGNREIKSACVERFNRTLLERLYRYFTAARTLRYVEILPKIIQSYNHSYHNAIKRSPASVTPDNSEDVWNILYASKSKLSHPKFKTGDRVKISIFPERFQKSYKGKWALAFYTVEEVLATSPPTYTLREDEGEIVKGSFYGNELQKVKSPKRYRVEMILRYRRRNGKDECFVKWQGYSDSYNSWVLASELKVSRFT